MHATILIWKRGNFSSQAYVFIRKQQLPYAYRYVIKKCTCTAMYFVHNTIKQLRLEDQNQILNFSLNITSHIFFNSLIPAKSKRARKATKKLYESISGYETERYDKSDFSRIFHLKSVIFCASTEVNRWSACISYKNRVGKLIKKLLSKGPFIKGVHVFRCT